MSALHPILKNERYSGRQVWNRSQWVRDPDTGQRQRRMRPPEEWIVREVPPVVDPALFQRVQARFAVRRHPSGGRGGVPRYLLSGLLTCGLCGARLVVTGGSQHRYRCGTHHAGGPAGCSNGVTVPRKLAEELILAPVLEQLLAPEAETAGVEAMRQVAAELTSEAPARDEVDTLQRLVRDGILTPETAAPALAQARRQAQARQVQQELASIHSKPGRAAWRAAVREIGSILRGEDVAAARLALQDLLGTVVCRPAPAGDHLIAELTACSVMLQTGTGIWIGSGGVMSIHLLPVVRRRVTSAVVRFRR